MTPEQTLEQSAEQANEVANGSMPWRFAVIDIDDIYSDRFQRPLNEAWLRAREGQLDPAMLGAVVLSERERRGKRYSGVDGQHRVELSRREGLDKIGAVVFYDLTVEQEANLFARFQRERQGITPYQRFNAELVAGSEQAKAIQKIVRDEGFTIASKDGEGAIKAIVALEKIYAEDPALLRTVLRLVRTTWGNLPYAQNERMLKGLWYFLRTTDDLDEQRFVDRLGQITPSALSTRAHNLREARGMSGAIPGFLAEAIEDAYRSQRKQRPR